MRTSSPTKSGLSLVDLSGGYVSTIAVLAGSAGGDLRALRVDLSFGELVSELPDRLLLWSRREVECHARLNVLCR